jgi:hypothetical protein
MISWTVHLGEFRRQTFAGNHVKTRDQPLGERQTASSTAIPICWNARLIGPELWPNWGNGSRRNWPLTAAALLNVIAFGVEAAKRSSSIVLLIKKMPPNAGGIQGKSGSDGGLKLVVKSEGDVAAVIHHIQELLGETASCVINRFQQVLDLAIGAELRRDIVA